MSELDDLPITLDGPPRPPQVETTTRWRSARYGQISVARYPDEDAGGTELRIIEIREPGKDSAQASIFLTPQDARLLATQLVNLAKGAS